MLMLELDELMERIDNGYYKHEATKSNQGRFRNKKRKGVDE